MGQHPYHGQSSKAKHDDHQHMSAVFGCGENCGSHLLTCTMAHQLWNSILHGFDAATEIFSSILQNPKIFAQRPKSKEPWPSTLLHRDEIKDLELLACSNQVVIFVVAHHCLC